MVGKEGPERGVEGEVENHQPALLNHWHKCTSQSFLENLGSWHILLLEWDHEGQLMRKSPEGCCLCIRWWAWGHRWSAGQKVEMNRAWGKQVTRSCAFVCLCLTTAESKSELEPTGTFIFVSCHIWIEPPLRSSDQTSLLPLSFHVVFSVACSDLEPQGKTDSEKGGCSPAQLTQYKITREVFPVSSIP